METSRCFEIHGLDNRVWVRPHAGNVEFNGETYDTLAEAVDALPMLALELGWTDYHTTYAKLYSGEWEHPRASGHGC